MGYNVYFDIHEAANWRILITGETTRSCELIEDLVKIFDIPFTNRHLKIKPFVFFYQEHSQWICNSFADWIPVDFMYKSPIFT